MSNGPWHFTGGSSSPITCFTTSDGPDWRKQQQFEVVSAPRYAACQYCGRPGVASGMCEGCGALLRLNRGES